MSPKQNYTGRRTSQDRTSGRQKRPAVLIVVIAVIVVLAAAAAVVLLHGRQAKTENTPAGSAPASAGATDSALTGTWAYGEYTRYDFESNGSGAMRLDDTTYPYTYSTDGDQLYLDFESDDLADAAYTYTISGDTLTLIGGEGTTGGAYELTRER